ncbi:MAG: toast rack family protein [Anaerolineae bacterium]|nr:toast rack family protein [Anaerolineae bacterium]
MLKKMFFVSLVLVFALSACSVRINTQKETPGPDIVDEVSIQNPDAETAFLTLEFGAGRLYLAPGAGARLLSGTATYNIADLKPVITEDGEVVKIHQGEYKMNSWPNLDGTKNEWDFRLGEMPLDLTVKAGAYEGVFDLGGLSLVNLTVRDGAADVKVDFSSANLVRMNVLNYQTGASNVTLKNLANANFTTLNFEGGAGNYTLDFGGELQQDAGVTLRAGMSNITLVIPEGLTAQITVDGGLSSINVPGGWRQNGNTYSRTGDGPVLTIVVDLGAGNLQIVE